MIRTTRALAQTGAVASLVFFIAAAVLAIVFARANGQDARAGIDLLLATGMFVVVGALIATRRPENIVGWLFCAIGLSWALGAAAVEYAVFSTVTRDDPLPAAWLGAWFGEWNWIAFWFLTLVATPMVFPTGRPLLFGARLRDQVDIATVRGDVLTVVGSTVQLSHASLWLRQETS